MRPPGLERNADERFVVYTGEHTIGEPRLLRAGRPGLGHAGQAVAAVAEQEVLHPPFCGEHPVDDGEVFLLKAVFADLLREDGRGHAAARKDHHAADRGVQPVNGADAVRAEGGAQQGRHTAGLVGREHAGRLEADGDPVVLIENVHGCLQK